MLRLRPLGHLSARGGPYTRAPRRAPRATTAIRTRCERANAPARAPRLVTRGVRKLVVAGGETSGAVVQALGVSTLRIGPTIDPGVPWTEVSSPIPLALALKSGNFGTVDFFAKALAMLERR